MKTESKRLFISSLPENISEEDLTEKLSNFGAVTSVEIKTRKNVDTSIQPSRFAFININIDNNSLQKCFSDFTSKKWKGHLVDIQIAKESFLERLKREREESNKSSEIKNDINNVNGFKISHTPKKQNNIENFNETLSQKTTKFSSTKKVYKSSSSSEDDTETVAQKTTSKKIYKSSSSEEEIEEISSTKKICKPSTNDEEDNLDIIIKNNKNKILKKNGLKTELKIESFGYEPIVKIEPKKPKTKDPKRNEADMKRIQSMIEMKKGYQQQKNQIKSALSSVDIKSKNKIVFDSDNENEDDVNVESTDNINKPSLFDDSEDEDDDNLNFQVKEQFEGKKGQKLLELQSKFKNDKRFSMDARFLEDDDSGNEEIAITKNDNEITLEEEKQKEFEILEEVLGKKIMPPSSKLEKQTKKSMLRFDPTQPEHSKYEVKPEVKIDKKKRKWKDSELHENELEENKPIVSKEKFYKVTEDLKETLKEKESFSLLEHFGKTNDEDENDTTSVNNEETIPLNKNVRVAEKNPFRYDSSDDEETEAVTEKTKKEEVANFGLPKRKLEPKTFWNETFFFKNDDCRLQEGIDFLKRLEHNENNEFLKTRRNLKVIIKTKIRNNQKKKQPFKKKLGGNSKRKMLRIKKAMKR